GIARDPSPLQQQHQSRGLSDDATGGRNQQGRPTAIGRGTGSFEGYVSQKGDDIETKLRSPARGLAPRKPSSASGFGDSGAARGAQRGGRSTGTVSRGPMQRTTAKAGGGGGRGGGGGGGGGRGGRGGRDGGVSAYGAEFDSDDDDEGVARRRRRAAGYNDAGDSDDDRDGDAKKDGEEVDSDEEDYMEMQKAYEAMASGTDPDAEEGEDEYSQEALAMMDDYEETVEVWAKPGKGGLPYMRARTLHELVAELQMPPDLAVTPEDEEYSELCNMWTAIARNPSLTGYRKRLMIVRMANYIKRHRDSQYFETLMTPPDLDSSGHRAGALREGKKKKRSARSDYE
ncbi:hypothetical protein JKP88DRAFT_303732, partial [Tribonema minus]